MGGGFGLNFEAGKPRPRRALSDEASPTDCLEIRIVKPDTGIRVRWSRTFFSFLFFFISFFRDKQK